MLAPLLSAILQAKVWNMSGNFPVVGIKIFFKSEIRGQRAEVRGQRSDVRGQMSDVRCQRAEGRGRIRSKIRMFTKK
jgi:hypothetical protein